MKKFIELLKKYPEVTIAAACAIALATIVTVIVVGVDKPKAAVTEDTTIETSHTIEGSFRLTEEVTEEITEEVTEEVVTIEETTTEFITPPRVVYYDVPLSHELQDHIFELCDKYVISPSLVIAIIEKESNYDPETMGDGGDSFGLMQIQPKWHRARMARLGCTNLLDPFQNVTVGIDILAELAQTRSSVEWILMAYNGGAGPATYNYNMGIITDYAQEVMEDYYKFEEEVN